MDATRREDVKRNKAYTWTIFPWGHIYSYFTDRAAEANHYKRMALEGLYAFIVLCLAVASYSVSDLLIVLLLACGQEELNVLTDKFSVYAVGPGISGIIGWLAGYLLARGVSKRRTWASVTGLFTFVTYTGMWMDGKRGISHDCHFKTMGEGFIAGLALEYFGPTPTPFKFLRRHIGKFVLATMLLDFIVSPVLEIFLPDPRGFVAAPGI